mmetsp:Transcript_22923/g.26132  ORF Transcript_22923/g.26132 Transcript_22923/m.26132 type:complete len:92 (-) Transcript_22923:25-300(-)
MFFLENSLDKAEAIPKHSDGVSSLACFGERTAPPNACGFVVKTKESSSSSDNCESRPRNSSPCMLIFLINHSEENSPIGIDSSRSPGVLNA